MQAGDAQVANVLDATKARWAEPEGEIIVGTCRTVQEPACSWESSNKSPFLESTTAAESAYFNCSSNHSQFSTESEVPRKFSFPQSVSVYSSAASPSSLVDKKSKHRAVLGSFVRVSCVPTQYSWLLKNLKRTVFLLRITWVFVPPKKQDLKQPAPFKFHIFAEEGVCEEDPTSTSLLYMCPV